MIWIIHENEIKSASWPRVNEHVWENEEKYYLQYFDNTDLLNVILRTNFETPVYN